MLNIKRLENNLILALKPIGSTPLDVVKILKSENPDLVNSKIGYAGRLDPMAEGVLLLMLGEENKSKGKYENLPKVYEIEVLFGFKTDTFDILGKVLDEKNDVGFDLEKTKEALGGFIGKFTQEYPPYSSKTVDGKPLYYYARRNLFSKIIIPTRRVEIYEILNIKKKTIKGEKLLELVEKRISLANGNFRQEEILKCWWEKIIEGMDYPVLSATIKCSSGTYMRSLANNLGEKLGIPALAMSIKRTEIGDFKFSS